MATHRTMNTWKAVFKNAGALSEEYVPERLLYRRGEYRKVKRVFSAAKAGLYFNMMLEGFPGSGKTATVLRALKDAKCAGAYVAAGETGYETLVKLARSLGLKVPPQGLSFDYIQSALRPKLPRIVVIDDVEKMMLRGGWTSSSSSPA